MNRISYLDGHRGIAILLVLLFHAFARWFEIMPYTDQYGDIPIFKYGYLGVQLFFLISGFVILMTLEKCRSFTDFIYRRWQRLFPAMLICSLIVFITASFFSERPNGQPDFIDLIPGLSFIDPYIWSKLTGVEFVNLEDAFWSLYVEFQFYIFAAAFYFLMGTQRLVFAIFICFLMSPLFEFLKDNSSSSIVSIINSLVFILNFKFFGWFASGAAYFVYLKSEDKRWLITGAIFSLISALVASGIFKAYFDMGEFIATVIISMFFMASLLSVKLQSLISNRLFLFLGFVSYPLYLLHENMMVSLVVKFHQMMPFIPSFLLPVIAVSLVSFLAWFISKYLEKSTKNCIVNMFSKVYLLAFSSKKVS